MENSKYFQAILEFQPQLRSFISRLHGHVNADEIEDLLQETNLTLIKKYCEFDKSKSFEPWAYSVARFTILAHRKKRAKEINSINYDSDLMDHLLELFPTYIRDQTFYEIERQRIKLLFLVCDELPKKQSFILKNLLNGKSLYQLSEELGVSVATLTVRKSRMIKNLKKILLNIKKNRHHDH